MTDRVTRAAGILFVTADGPALFLKRGPGGDHAGEWGFPGGRTEGEETPEETAKREAIEEIGSLPDGARQLWVRTISQPAPMPMPPGEGPGTVAAVAVAPTDAVDFTTFIQKVPAQFEPELNDEHTGYAWTPLDQPPEPLHPGCRIALARFTMDETGVAQAIAAGSLTSPQRYENMWLFALRITGTATAYRPTRDEYVYRRPENYLTPEFLARCNGLPVIMQHPEGLTLNSDEFAKRVIGSIALPYIEGDEVWGIARIYDDPAAQLMQTTQMSTSPAVVFRDPGVNVKMELDDGSTLLIEGKPSLLDHLAICKAGVWDKGGVPSGVAADSTGENMTDAEKKAAEEKAAAEARARADAGGEKLDKMLSCLDSLTKRMDAFEARDKAKADAAEEEKKKADAAEEEKKKGEAEKVAADTKKADEAAEEKKKADAAAEEEKKKADAANGLAGIKADIKRVEALLPKQLSDADYAAMADAQARADTVFSAFGGSAPRPLDGETLPAYKRRLAVKLKDHSPIWKAVDLAAIADAVAFGVAETQIYADAMSAALNPVDLPADQLRSIVTTDSTGRKITTYAGRPSAWMSGFSGQRQRLIGIRNTNR